MGQDLGEMDGYISAVHLVCFKASGRGPLQWLETCPNQPVSSGRIVASGVHANGRSRRRWVTRPFEGVCR